MRRTTIQHSLVTKLAKLAFPIAVVAIAAGATNAFGGLSLTQIPAYGTDTFSEARCITPDGKFVGGTSGAGAVGANGWVYDVVGNTVVRPAWGTTPKYVQGIAYRTDTNQVPAQAQIIIDGESSGWHAYGMSSDGGATWLRYLLNGDARWAYADSPPVANSLAATPGSDVFLSTFRSSDRLLVWAFYMSNLWTSATPPQGVAYNKSVTSPARVDTDGVAVNGRIAGWRQDSGDVARNNMYDWIPGASTAYQWKGLDGTSAGQAWSISQDGNIIFGWSHTLTDASGNYGCKVVLSGTSVNATPPGSGVSEVSSNMLPEHPLTTGFSVTREVPYGCTADGKYAVGYYYTHATQAGLWDTSDPNPVNWKLTDLSQLAADHGLGVPDVFRSLNRGYAAATNAAGDIVVTGYGIDVSGLNRAFVMTVPKSIAAAGYISPKLTMSGSFGGGFSFTFYAPLNTTCYVEYTSDLTPPATWTTLSTSVNGSGTAVTQFTVTDSTPDPSKRFYRLRVVDNP